MGSKIDPPPVDANGKIDYDAWIVRISEKWGKNKPVKPKRDLTKIF